MKIYGLALAVIFGLSGCNTGKKLLEKGDYYQAVMQSVNKLSNNADSKKGRATLASAYPLAVQSQLNRIKREQDLQSDFQHTESVYAYEDLNRLYEGVLSNPGARSVVRHPKKYYAQLAKEKPKAAEEQYLAGMQQLEVGNRESAKRAYYYFEETERFVKNYKEASAKKEEAYQLSILRVVVRFMPVSIKRYRLSAGAFYDEVNKTFRNIEQNKFIRFYTPQQAANRRMGRADHYLAISFEDFIVGQSHTMQRVQKYEKDSVLIQPVTASEGRYNPAVYTTVSAEMTTNRMEIVSNGLVKLTITDGGFDKRMLINQDFIGEFVWFTEWGRYNGDERALSAEQLDLCSQDRLRPPPSQQMFIEFTRPIYDQLNRKLTDFYRGY